MDMQIAEIGEDSKSLGFQFPFPDTIWNWEAASLWIRLIEKETHLCTPPSVFSITHDDLEFLLPTPVSQEKAMDAAVEQYGFCHDVIDQGPEEATVGALADVLRQSTVWYFWWD